MYIYIFVLFFPLGDQAVELSARDSSDLNNFKRNIDKHFN